MVYCIDFFKKAAAYRQEGHAFAQLRDAFDIPSAPQHITAGKKRLTRVL
jgi:hypothetical protein